MKKGKSRWKLDFEIGLGMAVVILIASVGFAAAATVKTAKPKYKGSLPKAAPRKVVAPTKKPTTTITPKVTAKDLIKPPATVRKESPPSSSVPVLTAPAPTPEAGFSSDY